MADNTRDTRGPAGIRSRATIKVRSAKASRATSRRAFIKGVIASGAAVSSAGYSLHDRRLLARGRCGRRRRAHADAQRQWPDAHRRRAAERDARDDAALQARSHGHEARLRPRRVRRMHGAHRRRRDLLVLDTHARVRSRADHDDRRSRGRRRELHPGAAGDDRRARTAMRVLHAGSNHVGGRVAQGESASRRATRLGTRCRATCAAAAPTITI